MVHIPLWVDRLTAGWPGIHGQAAGIVGPFGSRRKRRCLRQGRAWKFRYFAAVPVCVARRRHKAPETVPFTGLK